MIILIFTKWNTDYSNDYSIKEQISSNLTSYIKYINPHLFNNNNNKIIRISRNSLKENFNNKEMFFSLMNVIDNCINQKWENNIIFR